MRRFFPAILVASASVIGGFSYAQNVPPNNVSSPVVNPPLVKSADSNFSGFPLPLGVYDYSLKTEVLGVGAVDGASISVGVHNYSGQKLSERLDARLRDSFGINDGLYLLSLDFSLESTVAGTAARILVSDSSVKTVARVDDSGRVIPVACVMGVGGDFSEIFFDGNSLTAHVWSAGRVMAVQMSSEQYNRIVTPSTLISRIVSSSVSGPGVFNLGVFVDPSTGSLQSIDSVVESVRTSDIPEYSCNGFLGKNFLRGITTTPPSVFGNVSVRVGTHYTVLNSDGTFSAPMSGSLTFDIVNGGIASDIAGLISSGYTKFVRFIPDDSRQARSIRD
ncbi:hypothetical protein HY483_03775 [Candidatus Woesearchaeota archaeon]|nr:hypothetical protein [Candidatus Woesearchaeota archaeon]